MLTGQEADGRKQSRVIKVGLRQYMITPHVGGADQPIVNVTSPKEASEARADKARQRQLAKQLESALRQQGAR
jgi:hypothetical protein